MLTDRRRFLQLLASAAAVAACPTILLPADAVIEPVLISHAAPYVLPTVSRIEWTRLLWSLQEEHWRESREGASPCWTRYTKVIPA
jgi:hypothetical protein